MASNQYDNFIPSEYVPIPFSAYMQAGKAQQDAYNTDKDQLNQIQDKLATINKRQVDIPGANAIFDNYSQQGLDLLSNKYDPGANIKIRQLARQVARDPKLQAIQYAYNQQLEEKKIEDHLRAAGKTPYQRHRDWYEKPLFDQKGNQTWQDYDTVPLGTEAQHDYYKAAQEYTKDIAPRLNDLGISIVDKNIVYRDPNGGVQKLPMSFMQTGQRKTLDPHSQWVLNEVDKVLSPFTQSAEGNQYLHSRGRAFDTNDNRQKERYQAFGDKGKDIYGQDAARDLLLSTIKPVNDVNVKYDDVTAALKAAKGSGSNGGSQQPTGMPYYNAITGHGHATNDGNAQVVVTPNTPSNFIILTPDENKRAESRAEETFKEYTKAINSPAYNSTSGFRQIGKLFGIDGELTAEEFKYQALEKEKKLIQEVKKERLLKTDNNSAYTPKTWRPTDKATVSALEDKKASVNPANSYITNATGDNVGVNLQYVLDNFFEGAQYPDLVNNIKYSNQATGKSPNGYSTNYSEYSLEVPEKVAKKVRNTNSDIFNEKTVSKEGDKYYLKFKTPSANLYDPDSEINSQRSEGVLDDKDPYAYQKNQQFATMVNEINKPERLDWYWNKLNNGEIHLPINNKPLTIRTDKNKGTVKVPFTTSKGNIDYTDMQLSDFLLEYGKDLIEE